VTFVLEIQSHKYGKADEGRWVAVTLRGGGRRNMSRRGEESMMICFKQGGYKNTTLNTETKKRQKLEISLEPKR